MANIDLYVIHDTALTQRNDNIDLIKKTFSQSKRIRNIVVIDKLSSAELTLGNVKNLLRKKRPEKVDDTETHFEIFLKPLSIQQISNYLKHVSALESIVQQDVTGIVIEDDVIMSDDCESIIENYVKKGDIEFFGQPFKLGESRSQEILNFNENTMTLLPCIDSYAVDPTTARAILSSGVLPIAFQTNIAYSLAINRLKIKAVKVFPNAFIDGSKVGKFTSAINNNNVLSFNTKYNILYDMIQKDSVDFEKFSEIFSSAEFNDSPDMTYLNALCHLKTGRIVQSKTLFDQAYAKYCDNKCLLNKSSSFMCNYLKFFKILQDR